MDQAVLPLEMVQQKRSQRYLAYGIVLSTLLHVIGSVVLLGSPQGSSRASVTYLDLKNVSLPAPDSAPPQQKAPPQTPPPSPVPEPKLSEPAEIPSAPAPVAKPESAPAPTPPAYAKPTPQEEVRSVMGLGLSRGYFKSIAEGASLRGDVRSYYLDMLQGINEKWWMDEAMAKKRVSPIMVSITINRKGEIVDQEVMHGSGNSAYDKAVLEAIRKSGPLAPLPPSFEGETFQAPIRLVPPLDLFAW